MASFVPGQSKTRDHIDPDARNPTDHHGHDAGRGGMGVMGDAFKPSHHQSVGEKVGVEGDK